MAKTKKPFDSRRPSYKKIKCSKCENKVKVTEDAVSVICWHCVVVRKK